MIREVLWAAKSSSNSIHSFILDGGGIAMVAEMKLRRADKASLGGTADCSVMKEAPEGRLHQRLADSPQNNC